MSMINTATAILNPQPCCPVHSQISIQPKPALALDACQGSIMPSSFGRPLSTASLTISAPPITRKLVGSGG